MSKSMSLSLYDAAGSGDCTTVTNMLERGVDINRIHDEAYKWTALHYAADSGEVEMVRLLLEHGADVYSVDQNGKLPIHIVCDGAGSEEQRRDITEMLLEAMGKSIEDHTPDRIECKRSVDDTAEDTQRVDSQHSTSGEKPQFFGDDTEMDEAQLSPRAIAHDGQNPICKKLFGTLPDATPRTLLKNCEELEGELFEKEIEIDDLKEELDVSKELTLELDEEIDHLKEQVIDESDTIEKMAHDAENQMFNSIQEWAELNSRIKGLEAEKATLDQRMRERDLEVTKIYGYQDTLVRKIAQKDTELGHKTEQNYDKDVQIITLKSDLLALQVDREEYTRNLAAKDEIINNKDNIINNKDEIIDNLETIRGCLQDALVERDERLAALRADMQALTGNRLEEVNDEELPHVI